ncbi:MAG: amino acid ABC transporter permease [Beutenbergiaceae bacterium]
MPSPQPWTPSATALERVHYRAAQRRRSWWIALASTLVVIAVAVGIVVTSPGWERTSSAFFNPEVAMRVLPAVAQGLWLNLRVWVVAGVISLAAGLVLAVLRTSRAPVLFPVRVAILVYVDVFRGLPLLLVLLLAGFGLPALRLPWMPVSGVLLGTLAIVLTYTAYTTEIFRAGIDAVHPAQVQAARALGLTRRQATQAVVVPQAVRNVTAALLNTVVSLQKDSGLISILGAVDAIRAAEIAVTGAYNFTPYVVAGLLFLLISIPLTRAVDAYGDRRGWGASRPATGAWR